MAKRTKHKILKVKRTKLKTLMVSLYYPAVLGTCLFAMLNRLALRGEDAYEPVKDIAIYFAFDLILYFSASFLLIDTVSTKPYRVRLFILDVIEILIIFLAFFALGFFHTNPLEKPQLRAFYLLLIGLTIVQNLWNIAAGYTDKIIKILSITAVFIFLLGAFIGEQHLSFNIVIIAIGIIFIIYYVSLLNWEAL